MSQRKVNIKAAARNASKIILLRAILERKQYLFAVFNEVITHDLKTKKWKEIHEVAVSLGIVGSQKDFKYTRDVLWANFRRRTLEKKDNARKTGTGGGTECILNDMDKLVLEILGKDSPNVIGIGVSDSLAVQATDLDLPQDLMEMGSPTLENYSDGAQKFFSDVPAETSSSQTPLKRINSPRDIPLEGSSNVRTSLKGSRSLATTKRVIVEDSVAHENSKEFQALKKRKLELQIEHVELLNYKMKLEIFKMEKELQIEQSKFTNAL